MAERRKFAKKYCKYSAMKLEHIDYKNLELLKISMSERGKIMPRRLTGTAKRFQEQVENAIKRARHMALVPYIVDTNNVTESAYSRR
ncbi:MAG: 30S ribosomal protein S18 [Campylobacterota bacterium]|nr:30S ribosomal protein S18 [Campylobacterota bacterium]